MASRLYRLRQLERRAATIHRNSEALFSDLMKMFGTEGLVHGVNVTDDADNLMEAASEVCGTIELAIKQAKDDPA